MALLLVPHASLEGELLATCVPRDLLRGGFGEPISVLSRFPDVWRHNRFVRDVFVDQVPPGQRVVQLYAHGSGRQHALVQVMTQVSLQLGRSYNLTELRPHLCFSEEEKVREDAPGYLQGKPYWCMCVSLDPDCPTTWWDSFMWQQVTHRLSGDPSFPLVLQVGVPGWHTPALRDCLSLADVVTLRELLWLLYHSEGLLTGPCPLVHVAAACLVPSVVVAGGVHTPQVCSYDRAAVHAATEYIDKAYTQYLGVLPQSQVFDTIGQLDCCMTAGCELRRCSDTVELTRPGGQRCVQPRCLHAIPYGRVADSAVAIQRSRA